MDQSSGPSAVPPDALVAHAGFIRRIAGAILRDDADADDATQRTLVQGLVAGPREIGALRAWLATVARNMARGLRRRDARIAMRERRVALPEATGSVVDAVARQETLRAVSDAIGALDPAAREVVLLRHYDDLPPRAIASRLGLPVETVKKRLTRAHQALRVRLEESGPREGDRRRRTLAAFAGIPVPGVGTGAGALALKGAAVASGAKGLTVGVIVLLLLGAGTWLGTRPGSDVHDRARDASPRPPTADLATASAKPTLEAPPAGLSAGAAPSVASTPAAPSARELTPAARKALATNVVGDAVEGIVVTEAGPLADVPVKLEILDLHPQAAGHSVGQVLDTRTGPDGVFRWPGLGESWRVKVWVRPAGGSPRWLQAILAPPAENRRVVLVLGDGTIRGTVRDRSGAPAPGKRLMLTGSGFPIVETTTETDGTYELTGLPARTWKLAAFLVDGSTRWTEDRLEASVRVGQGEVVTLDLGPTEPQAVWRGAVRLGSGTRVRGPGVLWLVEGATGSRVRVPFDAEGRLEQRVPAGRYGCDLFVNDDSMGGESRFAASGPVIEIGVRDLDQDVVFPGVEVSGTVRMDGRAVAPPRKAGQGIIWHLGAEAEPQPGAQPAQPIRAPLWRDGTFRFLGLAPGRYRLKVTPWDPNSAVGSDTTVDVADRDVTGIELTVRAR